MSNQEQENDKPERIQFPKEFDAKDIATVIRQKQNAWAKKNPERAHALYPEVYDEAGNRIKP